MFNKMVHLIQLIINTNTMTDIKGLKKWKYFVIMVTVCVSLAINLVGAGAALVWLHATDQGIYDERAKLEAEIQVLEGEEMRLEAEQALLTDPTLLPR